MSLHTQSIFPCVIYRDARSALRWLEHALGFSVHFLVAGPDDSVAHAELLFEGNILMIGNQKSDSPCAPAAQTIYLAVDDIDTHFQRAQAAGAKFLTPLRDTDYGSREFELVDPEGNHWHVGTYRPRVA